MAISGELITCKNGHHYDPARHTECPICKQAKALKDPGYTRGNDSGYTAAPRYAKRPQDAIAYDSEHTVAAEVAKFGFLPVAGWLVSINGVNKGMDYRISCGRNFVGRDHSMDICIQGDNTISRQNHAIISYDDRTSKYYYSPGTARSIDHINQAPVFTTVELKAGDVLEIGTAKLRFVPLCSAKFRWED